MRPVRRPEAPGAFSISLLDAIACAFGAVILLVMLTPSRAEEEQAAAEQAIQAAALEQGRTAESIAAAAARHRRQVAEMRRLRRQAAQAEQESRRLMAVAEEQEAMRGQSERLREALNRGRALLAAAQDEDRPPPPQEAAGIPVDSDHVAIVLDTSGSMMPLWRNVMSEMSNVLSQYPQLKGFQVLSDQGEYLHSQTRGRWIPDTPGNRRAALRKMSAWRAYSASNPARGILQAVGDLYAPGRRMAVFVFGDDYQGLEFDALIDRVDRGVQRQGAADELRIHAVGFSNLASASHGANFAMLMRALTERHGGAFLALPEQQLPDRIAIRRSRGEPVPRPLD